LVFIIAALVVAILLSRGIFRRSMSPPALESPSIHQPFIYLRATRSIQPTVLPNVHFRDVAATAGLNYRWEITGNRPTNILQTIGNGCAFLDYNNDGNLDILLVGPKPALYRGDGRGHFTDVTHETGLDTLSGHFLGCAVGDYDNDGYPDLYLSAYRGGVLLHNEAGKRFHDVTAQAGLTPQPWGTSCAFGETTPGSGRLDLFISNYVDFGPDTDPQLCNEHGVPTSCGPLRYKALHGVFYANINNGRFADLTDSSGLAASAGKGLGVLFADVFGAGKPALYIANDEMPGDLFEPIRAAPNYKNVGLSSGAAFDRDGNTHGGLGVDCGDYDNDGRLDLLVTTFHNEPRSLYHNQGNGVFFDSGMMVGLGAETANYVAFGCKFLDFDNDGNLDIAMANGHIEDNAEQAHSSAHYRQPTQIFHNSGGVHPNFTNVSASSQDLMRPLVGRGLAVGDYDNDGRMDILVVDSEGAPLLLHNECEAVGHWLGVRLIGTRSNRDGYGAILKATIGKRTLLRYCHADGSYLSSSDPRVHFGLGKATRVDRLVIRWPSGHTDTLKNLSADRYLTIQEGN
jgi:hypothetical protein